MAAQKVMVGWTQMVESILMAGSKVMVELRPKVEWTPEA